MREILFRGKRISSGEWVIGGIMKTFHPNYDCKNEEDFLSQKPNCYCICANNKDYFVEQASIGQYTGQTDKNGTKIFEGDIVLFSFEDNAERHPFYIEYVDGEFRATPKKSTKDVWSIRIGSYACDFEVIGNVHDNPELMKGGE